MTISARIYKPAKSALCIVTSVSTGSTSSGEVTLKRLGGNTHDTAKGVLMFRYWQSTAENFVSPEQAAVVRTGQPSPEQGDKLEWLSSNLQDVCRGYGGQWIAVYNNGIVASALNLSDLMSHITEFDKPLVTFIPSEPVVWNFTYAV